MAPSLEMDTSDDFTLPSKTTSSMTSKRTLLLSPPSLSSHEEKLTAVLEMHDRSLTDMQMLDRVSMGFASLPESTYDIVIVLCDADGSRRESQRLLDRNVLQLLVRAMKAGASLKSQDGQFGNLEGLEKNEAILAGLSYDPSSGFLKPDYAAQELVPLRLGRKKAPAAANGILQETTTNGKRKSQELANGVPEGVGFDDGTANGEVDSDEELIDEDALLIDTDDQLPLKIRELLPSFAVLDRLTRWIAAECKPKAKRRRACKDCTCGLAAKLEAEDHAKRSNADQALTALKLQAEDLTEVDFTVQGKVGSCGNCSLGGACDTH
jgi:anamorsin